MNAIESISLVQLEILRFLNEFGFCEIQHISRRFGIRKSWAYQLVRWLVMRGYVMNARVMRYQPRAYYLTTKAREHFKLDLPVIKRIPLNIYEHQLAVIDVHLKLSLIHHHAVWVTERRLCRERAVADRNADDHLPDGVLVFPDGRQCAIEVEKTMKAKERLEGIMLGYGLNRSFNEVWYFCSAEVLSKAAKIAESLQYIKIYRLSEFI